MINISISVAWY